MNVFFSGEIFDASFQTRQLIFDPTTTAGATRRSRLGLFEELSDFEKGILADIYEQFGGMDKWSLRDMAHELPEWSDPGGSSCPIDISVILEAAGKSPEDIRRIKSAARELVFFSRMKTP